jgi:hypothetical protein
VGLAGFAQQLGEQPGLLSLLSLLVVLGAFVAPHLLCLHPLDALTLKIFAWTQGQQLQRGSPAGPEPLLRLARLQQTLLIALCVALFHGAVRLLLTFGVGGPALSVIYLTTPAWVALHPLVFGASRAPGLRTLFVIGPLAIGVFVPGVLQAVAIGFIVALRRELSRAGVRVGLLRAELVASGAVKAPGGGAGGP